MDPDRVRTRGFVPDPAGHLSAYAEVDVALDTFPYNGVTTTCEALSMGVPVVGLVGRRAAARHGLALLSALGRPGWAAPDVAGYVRLAVELAADRAGLARLRAELPARLAASPLADGTGLARSLEAAYREMWRRWCREGGG